jgi:hypothetical protein
VFSDGSKPGKILKMNTVSKANVSPKKRERRQSFYFDYFETKTQPNLGNLEEKRSSESSMISPPKR